MAGSLDVQSRLSASARRRLDRRPKTFRSLGPHRHDLHKLFVCLMASLLHPANIQVLVMDKAMLCSETIAVAQYLAAILSVRNIQQPEQDPDM